MRSTRLVQWLLVIKVGLLLPVTASTSLDPDGHGCCLTVLVQDAEGISESLNGEYQLKVDELDKPDPNCLDGCVYTRSDDPKMEEYCFSQTDQLVSVLPTSCPATSTLASFGTTWEGTSSVTSVSTSTSISETTTEISVLNLREETEKQIAGLDALINNVDSSSALKTELEKLKNLLSGLSGSLTTFDGGRVKRSTTLTCSELAVIISAYEYITTLVQDILNQMNGIGTKTGNTDLDNFISTTTEMYSQVDVTTQLQLFKGIQAQQECGASTYSLTAASTTSTRNKVAV